MQNLVCKTHLYSSFAKTKPGFTIAIESSRCAENALKSFIEMLLNNKKNKISHQSFKATD